MTLRERLRLYRLRRRAAREGRNVPGSVRLSGFDIRYTDLLSLYVEYKDIFMRRIYHFATAEAAPMVIDGGGCIGMSVLYFKRCYPRAKVLCFEPDAQMFALLEQNMRANQLEDVRLVQAGLSDQDGDAAFLPDGSDGGRLVAPGAGAATVRTVRLSPHIDGPVDFLKLNIEGAELPVLRELESSGKLAQVRRLVIEYHGWANDRQKLAPLLELLDRNGFRYVLHDFDEETNPASKPPFAPRLDTTWFCLVGAARA
jgi:FkbM family methyltransferase